MNVILKDAKNALDELKEIRRFLHEKAEVGFKLDKTMDFIFEKLKEYGYEPKRYDNAGIVATVGKGDQECFLLRADIDGLPIKEKSGESFACRTGNMHACGHDLHATMLLGAAKLLKEREGELKGRVKLFFQPAEEILSGAKTAIDVGVLKMPKVIGALALHVTTGVPLACGQVIVPNAGVGAPAADYFRIEVKGKSCHGSSPQNGVDCALVCSNILLALQTVIAREIPPSETAALTVGRISSGVAANVIAGDGVLEGTLRAFDEKIREKIKVRLKELSKGIADSFKARAKVTFTSGCPSLVNDEKLVGFAYEKASELLGETKVFKAETLGGDTKKNLGGSEDFAYIAKEIPSVLLAIGAGELNKGYEYPLHHPKVRFDENALPVGAALYAYIALKFFE